MLMANSVEGRFPFLDKDVVALADSLPAAYKLHVLDEKHVLKKAAKGAVPEEIVRRSKQPYRAPDAVSFTSGKRPEYVDELLAPNSIAAAGVFEPSAVSSLWSKCKAVGDGQFSNADNMALVGVLSTQLLHHQYVRLRPGGRSHIILRTDVDRVKRVVS
jgi:asparagine synthase (glutamine-hydrolysing)